MQRRSALRATPRKRYTEDVFEDVEGLEDYHSDHSQHPATGENDSGDDFEADLESLSSEKDLSDGRENVGNEYDTTWNQVTPAMEGDKDTNVRPTAQSVNSKQKNKKQRRKYSNVVGDETRTRGIQDSIAKITSLSKQHRRLYYFGPSPSDYKPAFRTRLKWAYDPVLPSRESDEDGYGGFQHSPYLDDDQRVKQAEKEWDWWYDGIGRGMFLANQRTADIGEKETQEYFPEKKTSNAKTFVMGPFKNQQLFNLPIGCGMPLRDAWAKYTEEGTPSFKNGFILHLGTQIKCLEWLPNQQGLDQYLLVSTLPERKSQKQHFEASEASAFTPQYPHKANVQIWKFACTTTGHFDLDQSPQMALALCTDWGDAKDLKFARYSFPPASAPQSVKTSLLGSIWSDGALRVLHIAIPESTDRPIYRRINKALFQSRPPNTICTCLEWISSTRIAAGCANGCIAIWDLPTGLSSECQNPRPVVYTSICTTYILSLASCSPSRPSLLLGTSMSGFLTMTNISQDGQPLLSQTTTVTSQRSRIIQPLLAWHDFSQTALQGDENCTLRGYSVRRLFTSVGLGRTRSIGTSIAGSPVHPFVLIGSASGEVSSLNPTRRILDGKAPIWQQTWFSHMWRRPAESEAAMDASKYTSKPEEASISATVDEPSAIDRADGTFSINGEGLTRITEGFKAERIVLTQDSSHRFNNKDGVLFATIYEAKSAITAVAWNPNIHVGGWAAAGCGDGLLRVEDIAT